MATGWCARSEIFDNQRLEREFGSKEPNERENINFEIVCSSHYTLFSYIATFFILNRGLGPVA